MKLKDLQKGDTCVGDCGYSMEEVPEWMDFEKFKRGREFFLNHISAMTMALHCSLVTGFSLVNLLVPLVFTGQSDTPKKAFSRYFQTFLHIALWHYEDVWEAPNGRAHKSVKLVRKMHNQVAKEMNGKVKNVKNGVGGGNKLYFSQYDMALVQSGFMGAVTMYPEGFGIKCAQQELEDYIFFWRGMGYLLGIEDEYNMCAGTFEETYALSKEIENTLMLPGLKNPPEHFTKMQNAYVDGTGSLGVVSLMTTNALMAFIIDGFSDGKDYQLPFPTLNLFDWLRYFYLKSFVFLIRWCPYFEKLNNAFIIQRLKVQFRNLKL